MTRQNVPLHQLVAAHLRQHAGERMTIAQVVAGVVEEMPERFAKKEAGLGSRAALLNQLTREVYARRSWLLANYPWIIADSSKSPIRLFVEQPAPLGPVISAEGSGDSDPRDTDDIADAIAVGMVAEADLYAPLQVYMRDSLGMVSRRIRDATSSNRRGRNGNKWLHPDIVGMVAPGQDWNDLVRQCAIEMPNRKARIVALEVKIRITSGTVREYFFQAVSNSMWANQGYLVATEVSGEDTFLELTTLCALHGIGYISLDPENPSESRVLIPARERDEVDWASANRIAVENSDFREFLSHVLNYLQTGRVMAGLWSI